MTKPLVTNIGAVRQALFMLFNTNKGERLFLPEYGSNLEDILFEPIDDATALVIHQRVVIAIEFYEPRVLIDYANTSIKPLYDDNRYDITLTFSVKGLEGEQFEYRGSLSL